MANPNSRSTLKDYCLRRLGHPVIQINVDNDQLEDRIDDALQKYKTFHYEGTELMYIPHQISQENIDYQYIPIDSAIERIVKIAPLSNAGSIANMFSFEYQFRLNDMRSMINIPTTNYVITQQNLQLLHNIFVGELSFEYNYNTQRLFIQAQWGVELQLDQWLLTECYVIVDPETYTKTFNDSWLKAYTTELFRRQWGENMMKFGGLELPGGITLNGKDTFDVAMQNIAKLEDDLETKYQPPPMFIVG